MRDFSTQNLQNLARRPPKAFFFLGLPFLASARRFIPSPLLGNRLRRFREHSGSCERSSHHLFRRTILDPGLGLAPGFALDALLGAARGLLGLVHADAQVLDDRIVVAEAAFEFGDEGLSLIHI